MAGAKFTVRHSEWGEDPYGWQVLKAGELLDTYGTVKEAEAYAAYMNERSTCGFPGCDEPSTAIVEPFGQFKTGGACSNHYSTYQAARWGTILCKTCGYFGIGDNHPARTAEAV